ARIPGSSLFPLVWRRVVDEGRSAVVVAPSRDVGEALRTEHPTLGVVVPPYFDVEDRAALAEVLDECEQMIHGTDPELVMLGIGFPKQQHIATALIERLDARGRDVPVFLLLGGSLDMYLGRVRRAPDWVQRAGLEWFYRFLKEPRRLFRRYFVTDMRFVPLVVEEYRHGRRPRTGKDASRDRT
ncbi:MAG: N-acetylglucosaminyldiphosphoundecaprenol N-acetyl-beta-D-mannosaminyltransferase, partial [Actinomycetota bacterium]|nr:N-acetylglucosaminyldiphosphoundecaprenol N-acetyl-beta-D-mannosaminyltransferase [Actinomycetota bacterium]